MKGHLAGERVEPDRAQRQGKPAAQRVDQIDPARAMRLGRAAMHDERPGGEGQKLEEDEEGKEVARHGDARRSRRRRG